MHVRAGSREDASLSIDTPPSPVPADAEALLAAAEGMGDKEIQALVARLVIDSLGRPWDPMKHPRDSEGKFIETFAEVRGLFRTSGGGKGEPRVSGRVVAFDHNGDVLVRVDHVADGYTDHKPGDLVPIKPDDIQAMQKLATIPKALDGEQRTQIDALAVRMEGRNPEAAAALRRAADPANTQPIAQLADLQEARDALDADGSPDAVAVRDAVWDLADQLGDHPSNDEVLKAAQAMVRDHLAKNPGQNAEAIARLDGDIHAEAPPAQPSAPDAAQRLAGQLHGLADRLQDQNPADATHIRNVAAALGDVGMTGESPEQRDARLEKAATAALRINNAQLKKKLVSDIKRLRENPPAEAEPQQIATIPEPAPAQALPNGVPVDVREPHVQQTLLGQLIQAARDGGFTFDARNTDFKQDGFAVARQGLGESFSLDDPDIAAKIDAYIDKHWDTLSGDNGAYLGGWANDGTVWLDVPDVLDSREEAIAEGQRRYEIAIADLAAYARGEDGEIRLQYATRPPAGTPAHDDWTDLEGVRHVGEPESARPSPAGAGRDEGAVPGPGEAAPASPEARLPEGVTSAPGTAPSDTPTDESPDDPDAVDLAAPETAEAPPAAPAGLAQLGDLGLGVQWENLDHGLVLRGNVFPHKDDAKAVGFRFMEVPGEKKRDGSPFKAWTATGTPDQRQAKLASLAERLGLPNPAAADGGDGGDEYPPTPQQQEIIDAVLTGKDVVVRALAGTGKTSTLKMLARRMMRQQPDKRIAYIAFNKSIQEEAQKTMPPNVEARTGDSIAFATMSPAMKDKYSDRSTLRRNSDIADYLGIRSNLDVPGQPPLTPEEQAMRVMRAIEKFSISADDEISPQHFEGLPTDVAINLLPFAQKAWNDINDEHGKIRTTNSHITKMWALTRPDLSSTTSGLRRGANVIFFDEAQDINPVMAKVIADQKIQKVYVGDGNQAIYGFRGAEDQLDKVKADFDLPLTKSWRFGPQIAAMGNRFLALLGSKHRIEGAGPEGKIDQPYTMEDPDAILVRSNAGAIGEILAAQHAGKLVGVPKGTKEDLRKLVDTARWLQQGGRPPSQVHDDLAAFRTWDEVRKAAEAGDDPKIKMLYGIVEDNGIPALNDLVDRLIASGDKGDNRTPDIIVTTAHKAKGMEWDKVKIGADFRGPRIDKDTGEVIMPSPEEMRLAYVAVTRAQKELDPGSLAWVYDYTNENGEEVKPETPTPASESPADLPSSPERWSTPSTPPGTPDSGGDVTPTPPTPEPVAEVPPTPPADFGPVPDGWTQPGDVEGIWNKGAYSVIDGKELGIDGLRVVEFDENDIPGWRADAANWDDVERLVADHESVKDGGGLEQKDRDHLAKLAERYGLGNDLLDAIKNGTPDQIQAALEQDAKYNEMKSAYTDALGAGTRNDGQKKAFQDWFDLNFEVLGALKQAKLLVGDDKPAPAAQEAPDTRTPQAPEVPPVAQPEVPGYSGEIRDIQPRDLAEILNAVENAKQWIDGYAENEYIVPGNKYDFRIHQQFQGDFDALDDAVRTQDFERAQQKLDDIKNALTPDVAEQFRDDVNAYVDQIQGVLDKVAQRDRGQFEIPGVAPQSVPPFAEHAAPELNAAFDDMVQHDPDVARDIKDLNDALIALESAIDDGGDEGDLNDQVRQVRQWLNERNYQAVINLLPGITGQHKFPTPWSERDITPEPRYSNYLGHERVQDVARRVESDWNDMLAAQAPESAPDVNVPASQEPLAEWEKALLEGFDKPEVMTPDMVDAANEDAQKREMWRNIVAQMDAELGGTYMGDVYNAVIQDQNITKPDQIEAVVARQRSKYVAEGDQPAVDIIDRIIRENQPGPESNVPGPYDPAANPEAVLPDVPGDGSPIKDERRVIDGRVRGEIEDVKRGVGLPELPDRLDIDRNGAAVFALDLVDVPAAGKQGKGDRRRPPGIGQVRRIYTKNGVRYAEVAFYDPAFVDYPNRNRVKAAAGIKNGSPFYVWDGIRLDKVQKVDGANPDAVEFLGHLGPEEARQYAGRNAGRLAQNRGRVRPELERMANLQYIGDRYVPDANGLPVGKGDVVLYNGKKYEVVRVNNDNPGIGNNVRLDLLPLGANGEPELQAGGKHAEPYARMVQFYDQPLGDRDPGVTVDELKDLVRRLDADQKYAVGQAVHDALERGDLAEITRAFNEDPAIQTYIADGRAYINDYIQRLLNANLRGNFDAINKHEQEMVRKDKNDLLNAMAAIDGRYLEGTGADRHIRRVIPQAGPDREYKGNQPEVLMPLNYVKAKEAAAKQRAAHPEDDGLWATVEDAIARAGALNLDDEDNYWAAMREFEAIRQSANGGLRAPELGDAMDALQRAMDAWHQDQEKRRAIRQGGPGAEAQLPAGRTIAPGLIRPPMPDKPVPAGQNQDDKTYADRLGMDPDARARYMQVREILDKAARAAADMPELQQYLDEANRALMNGNYGEAYHAIENVLGVPVDHPNAEQLAGFQARFAQIPEYFDLIKAMREIQGKDWPNDFFPDTAEINAGKAPAAPAAPNVPPPPQGFNVEPAENFQVGDVWVVEDANDLGWAHPGIGEWKIKEIVPGNTANRYVLERVGGQGKFGDEAEAYLRHGAGVKRRPGGVPQAPAAPAAPAVPQKPAVDMPDHMREMLKGKGDRFIRPEAKDAADALNAGMAPNGPDLQALHEDVQKRIDHYEAQGNRPGKVAEYQEVKDWLDTYAPLGGGAPAAPAAPAAPREAADIRQAIADDIQAVYDNLRADRKNNAARKQALDIQDAGDAIDAALDQAIAYHGGDGGDDIDTRNTEMSRARAAVESDIRPIDSGLADKLDDMLAELEKRFDRDDNERLANRYMDEAQKFHDRDRPDNDQRDRMLRAAQDQVDRIRRVDPTAADELDARLKAMQDTFAAEDVERARAKPVGRTQAIDEFDAEVEAERKRLRDAGQKAEARALADDAEAVAEAINDAEDAHKAGDVAARDSAIEKARAAAEEIAKTNPDLAEIARRAVEGNAARFARADARGAGGTTDDEIDTTPRGDRVKQAASDLHALAEKYGVEGWVYGQRGGYRLDALQNALRKAQKAGEIQHVTTVGGAGFNGAPLVVTFNDGVRMVVKNDATGHGARAEQVLGRLYRGLGFVQPLVTAMSQDPNDDLRHFIVMEHLDDLGGAHYEGAGDPYDFDAEAKREAFDIQLANAIMASTDRHPGNIMHGKDKDGRERLWLYDNGIALFNGAFGQPFGAHVDEDHHDRDYANQQGDYGYVDPEVTPAQFVLSGRARGGVYVGHNYHSAGKISVDWMDSKTDDEIRSEIEDFVDRMEERAKAMAFLTPEEIQFITIRGGWAKANWREMVDAMYELRNKKRKWKS